VRILLENVRSFCGRHEIPVCPLTLLVGENSTGKSTFLAMLNHVSDYRFGSLRPSFNEEPFKLGTYDSIATYKGGRFGRADAFAVGTISSAGKRYGEAISTYASYKGQPQLARLEANVKGGKILLDIDSDTLEATLKVHSNGAGSETVRLNLKGRAAAESEGPIPSLVLRTLYEQSEKKGRGRLFRVVDEVFFEGFSPFRARSVIALAPVRTRPKRTYDVISDEFSPEGDHIPVLLARILQGEDVTLKERLIEALTEFGTESGLFERISVKSLGARPSDPFQILVSLVGPAANLLDVGYGVSQALPIVVQSILAQQRPHPTQLLLQQPEVHLHPRGQAALGSFFSRLVARTKMEFVVETHSDYLVDRVRQEVARGTIAHDKVLILFFDKKGIETTVDQLHLDERGNVVDAPSSYRQFFLEEETNLLRRTIK